jgi:hypothetical protein
MPTNNHKDEFLVDEKRVWEKVMHTDARVTAMESQIQDVSSSVNRIENMLLNRQETSPIAWFGVIFSVLGLCGAMIWGMAQYVSLNQAPVVDQVNRNDAQIQKLEEWQNKTHYELGVIHERFRISDRDRTEP